MPSESNKEKFNLRLATFFLFRPFLGVIAGLIVYYGGDVLNLLADGSPENMLNELQKLKESATSVEIKDFFQAYSDRISEEKLIQQNSFKRIIFFSLLAGLFAKTLIEILKGMFKGFFGRG